MTNRKTTKKALIFSALSLLLCFSMLVGTTFAWFTDSVTSANNIIQSGTLKIDLEHYNPATKTWTSIKESKAPIFTYENWEPGYVDVQLLKIENEGSLALKWVATFKSDVELSKLADVIDVYVKPSATEITYPTSRDDIANWEKVGTVAEFVNTIEETTNGTLLEGESAYLGIALKMQETAGNEYQNQKLGEFTIQILATQMTAELDSFGPDYDKAAPWTGKVDVDWYNPNATEFSISSAEELAGLAQIVNTCVDSFAGKTVKLASNIDLNNLAWTPIGDVDADKFVGFQGTFDGQGYTIANLKIDSNSWGQGLFGYMTKNVTIQKVNVHNATVKAADTCGVIVGYATYGTFSNIHVTGNVSVIGTSDAAESGHVGGIAGCGYYATFDNCSVIANGEITSAGSFVGGIVGYQSAATKAITGCTVKNVAITGESSVGGIAGIIASGTTFANNSVESVVLTKIRVGGYPKIGALIGCYDGSKDTALANCSAKDVTLNGNYEAYAAYNVLYGAGYTADAAAQFDVSTTAVANITNNLVEVTVVSDAAGLKAENKKNGNIYLSAGEYDLGNFSLAEGVTLSGDEGAVITGTLTSTMNNVTVKNVTIKGGNAQRWAYAKGTVVFENCTFEATGVYAIHYDGTSGADIVYKNCTITGWVAIAGGHNSLTFDGCTINGNGTYGVIRTYSDATIKNCTFDVDNVNTTDVYQDGIHAVDCTITVENCTNVNGDIEDIFNVSGTGVINKN